MALRIGQTCVIAAGLLACCALALRYLNRAGQIRQFRRMSLHSLALIQRDHLNDPVFLFYFGRRLNDAGSSDQAIPVLERAAGLEPDDGPVRDEWARALLQTGQVTRAFGELRQYLGTHPGSAEAHYLIGKFYFTEGSLAPARSALQEAVRLDAGSGQAWSLLAQALIKTSDTGGAEAAVRKALAIRPDSAEDHVQLASLLAARNLPAADKEFRTAIELAPGNEEAHREYSRYLLAQKRAPEAETQARLATRLR
ncbi:MAG TPA: tetratricopeptide repeat protein, partial [Chthonomonadales bacterium]|nr:tetratricopeptide repeat protein [Chthonomonadales bacterium]